MSLQHSPQKSGKKEPSAKGKSSAADPNVTIRRKTLENSEPDDELAMDGDLKKLINSKFNKMLLEFRELKEQYRAIEASLTYHTEENRELKSKIEELQKQNKDDRIKIDDLETQVNELQRCQVSSSIEIRNVPKVESENLLSITETLFKALEMKEKPKIRSVNRLPGKTTESKPIIVELDNSTQKQSVLEKYKKFVKKNKDMKDKQLDCETIGFSGNKNPLFISEVLTQKTKKLFFLARKFRKAFSYKYCWTTNGRVYLRKQEGGTHILVKSEAQLANLETEIIPSEEEEKSQ